MTVTLAEAQEHETSSLQSIRFEHRTVFLRCDPRSYTIQVLFDHHACEREPRCVGVQDRAGLEAEAMVVSMIMRRGGWPMRMNQLEEWRWDTSWKVLIQICEDGIGRQGFKIR